MSSGGNEPTDQADGRRYCLKLLTDFDDHGNGHWSRRREHPYPVTRTRLDWMMPERGAVSAAARSYGNGCSGRWWATETDLPVSVDGRSALAGSD